MPRQPPLPSVEPVRPRVPFESCPLELSLGCLGRKWALIVLRDVAFQRDVTFGQLLRRNPEMTPRVLSMRLRDLRKEGVIERLADSEDGRKVHYRLTERGQDVVPVLTALIQYGIRHHADRVFDDKKPRELERVFPGEQPFLLGGLAQYARKADKPPSS